MLIFKILFYVGFSATLIASIIKIIGRHKTGYCAWGEPELDIVQVGGVFVGLVGILFSA